MSCLNFKFDTQKFGHIMDFGGQDKGVMQPDATTVIKMDR